MIIARPGLASGDLHGGQARHRVTHSVGIGSRISALPLAGATARNLPIPCVATTTAAVLDQFQMPQRSFLLSLSQHISVSRVGSGLKKETYAEVGVEALLGA